MNSKLTKAILASTILFTGFSGVMSEKNESDAYGTTVSVKSYSQLRKEFNELKGAKYTVSKGDTVYRLAKASYVTQYNFKLANGLKSSSNLKVGQKVYVGKNKINAVVKLKLFNTDVLKKREEFAALKPGAKYTTSKDESIRVLAKASYVFDSEFKKANKLPSTATKVLKGKKVYVGKTKIRSVIKQQEFDTRVASKRKEFATLTDGKYVVKPNESVYFLAKSSYVFSSDFRKANDLDSKLTIVPEGKTVYVGKSKIAEILAKKAYAEKLNTIRNAITPQSTYTVKSGDTLAMLAEVSNVSETDFKKANRLNELVVGKTVYIGKEKITNIIKAMSAVTPPPPPTERPTTERPTTERSTTERPTTERPTTERPTTERPTTELPTTERPTTEKPATVNIFQGAEAEFRDGRYEINTSKAYQGYKPDLKMLNGDVINAVRLNADIDFHNIMNLDDTTAYNKAKEANNKNFVILTRKTGEYLMAPLRLNAVTQYEFNTGYIVDKTKLNAEFINLLNAERKSLGLNTVTYNYDLQKGTDVRADELRKNGDQKVNGVPHVRLDGVTPAYTAHTNITDARYHVMENTAMFSYDGNPYGVVSEKYLAEKLFTQWKNSPLHYKAMTTPSVKQVALGSRFAEKPVAISQNGLLQFNIAVLSMYYAN